jgi:hypothetical protein
MYARYYHPVNLPAQSVFIDLNGCTRCNSMAQERQRLIDFGFREASRRRGSRRHGLWSRGQTRVFFYVFHGANMKLMEHADRYEKYSEHLKQKEKEKSLTQRVAQI